MYKFQAQPAIVLVIVPRPCYTHKDTYVNVFFTYLKGGSYL